MSHSGTVSIGRGRVSGVSLAVSQACAARTRFELVDCQLEARLPRRLRSSNAERLVPDVGR